MIEVIHISGSEEYERETEKAILETIKQKQAEFLTKEVNALSTEIHDTLNLRATKERCARPWKDIQKNQPMPWERLSNSLISAKLYIQTVKEEYEKLETNISFKVFEKTFQPRDVNIDSISPFHTGDGYWSRRTWHTEGPLFLAIMEVARKRLSSHQVASTCKCSLNRATMWKNDPNSVYAPWHGSHGKYRHEYPGRNPLFVLRELGIRI